MAEFADMEVICTTHNVSRAQESDKYCNNGNSKCG